MDTIQQKQGDSTISRAVLEAPKMTYCLYARKSTESDEKQALSIESQVKEMLRVAERDNLEVIDIRRESHSAKDSGQRPVFAEILTDLRSGRFNGILTWAPDRLSRNAGDLGSLVDLMDQKLLIEIRTFGQTFTNSPSDKFLLMILCSQAKLENDNKSINVKRGLRMRCEMGLWPAPAPTGYLNEKRIDRKGYIMPDPERASIIRQMFEKVGNDGWSGRKVYRWLREINFKTVNNKPIWVSSVQKILNTPIYMGEFQYPAGSGTWYKGQHEPLISKELYFRAREVLKRESEFRYLSKDFAFTRLMRCGHCQAGVTAQEKHKRLKGGGEAVYIYYGCTRSKDINCPITYIREEELILQLIGLIDKMTLDELGLRNHLKEDIERHQKFGAMLGIERQEFHLQDFDIKNYAKHVLKSGATDEKRQILSHLKNRIVLKDKVLTIE